LKVVVEHRGVIENDTPDDVFIVKIPSVYTSTLVVDDLVASTITVSGTLTVENMKSSVSLVTGSTTLSSLYTLVSGSTNTIITLPDAVANSSYVLVVKKLTTDGNLMMISASLDQTIDGSTTPLNIAAQYTSVKFLAFNGEWFIV
jgi:hypothetical protein